MLAKYLLAVRIYLGMVRDRESCAFQSEVDAADAGEQTQNTH
jgi:hypothetical protein